MCVYLTTLCLSDLVVKNAQIPQIIEMIRKKEVNFGQSLTSQKAVFQKIQHRGVNPSGLDIAAFLEVLAANQGIQ